MHRRNRRAQPLLIPFRASPHWRPSWPRLPKWQIAPQHRDSRFAERIRQRCQQWRLAIRSGPMRQNQPIRIRVHRPMQKPSHRRVTRRIVLKRFVSTHRCRQTSSSHSDSENARHVKGLMRSRGHRNPYDLSHANWRRPETNVRDIQRTIRTEGHCSRQEQSGCNLFQAAVSHT